MSTKPLPRALPVHEALHQSAAFAHLVARVQDSRRRLEVVQAALPALLRSRVRTGALDEQTWTLLAENAAVAAKLRHLLPLLEKRLLEQGWPARTIRVKVETFQGS